MHQLELLLCVYRHHPDMCSKGEDENASCIPAKSAYGVYISQLIRYSRACGFYQDFLSRGLLLTMKLLN